MNLDYRYYLKEAYKAALQSPDTSTQNGAILISKAGEILTADCNHLPDGVQVTPERLERPLKYAVIEHAERNSIFAACRKGIQTEGLIMVCPWAACDNCARAIIQAGIRHLVTHKLAYDRSPPHWIDSIKIAFDMFKEAGVEVEFFNEKVGADPILHCGEIWHP